MHPVKITLSNITLEESTRCGNLAMFPLCSALPSNLVYLMLGEALGKGLVTVREISASGSVPDLAVENRAHVAVLIVDGEALVGAKQNRVANLSILIPAGRTTIIPVSCVEQGRWRYASPEFAVADHLQFARGRAEKLGSVHRSMRSTGTRRADQGQVWRSIREKADSMHVASPTGAMDSIFEGHSAALDAYVEAFVPRDHQVGAVFMVANKVVGLDVFDQASTFAALLPKLVRSYGIDALERPTESAPVQPLAMARAFIDQLMEAQPENHPAVGLGEDVSIVTDNVVAGGLVVDSTLVHLSAFANPGQHDTSPGANDQYASFDQRRRYTRRRYH